MALQLTMAMQLVTLQCYGAAALQLVTLQRYGVATLWH
jgi:hypothetical protein